MDLINLGFTVKVISAANKQASNKSYYWINSDCGLITDVRHSDTNEPITVKFFGKPDIDTFTDVEDLTLYTKAVSQIKSPKPKKTEETTESRNNWIITICSYIIALAVGGFLFNLFKFVPMLAYISFVIFGLFVLWALGSITKEILTNMSFLKSKF